MRHVALLSLLLTMVLIIAGGVRSNECCGEHCPQVQTCSLSGCDFCPATVISSPVQSAGPLRPAAVVERFMENGRTVLGSPIWRPPA